MKDEIKDIIKVQPSNVQVAITTISLGITITLIGIGGNFVWKQIQKGQQEIQTQIENVSTQVGNIEVGVDTLKHSVSAFRRTQSLEHLRINTTLDIIKKAQTKNTQLQIEQSNQIFDQLKRKPETYYPVQPIWADSVLVQKKSSNSLYVLGNGNKF